MSEHEQSSLTSLSFSMADMRTVDPSVTREEVEALFNLEQRERGLEQAQEALARIDLAQFCAVYTPTIRPALQAIIGIVRPINGRYANILAAIAALLDAICATE